LWKSALKTTIKIKFLKGILKKNMPPLNLKISVFHGSRGDINCGLSSLKPTFFE
jgi:hypothetical protein